MRPLCDDCPLKGRKRIKCKMQRSPLAIVGEGPSGTDETLGEYFTGEPGVMVRNVLARHNIPDPHMNMAVQCKPPMNLGAKEWRKAVECCSPRLEYELKRAGVGVILAAGTRGFNAVTKHWGPVLSNPPWIGSVIPSDLIEGVTVVPTVSPAFCLAGNRRFIPIWHIHLLRAYELSKGDPGFEWQRLLYFSSPVPDILHALVEMAAAPSGTIIGLDIETGGVDPLTSPLTAIGVATKDVAVSVLWPLDKHFENEIHRKSALHCIKEILAREDLHKVAHNGVHDILGLEAHGLPINGYKHDTLLMHHVAGPTLPHNLGFVAQTELGCGPWKKMFKVSGDAKGLERFLTAAPEELTLYNAKDTACLPLLVPPLLERVKETNRGEKLYAGYLQRSFISMEMRRHGARIDKGAVLRHSQDYQERIRESEAGFRSHLQTLGYGAEDASAFKPSSNAHVKGLFFDRLGIVPTIYSKKTGAPSLPAKQLKELAANGTEEVRTAARYLLEYRKYTKLFGTYIQKLTREDMQGDYIHATPKVWGTKSGRWSYADPNLQNMPPSVRDIIAARPGDRYVLESDFGQLELRILAFLCNDERMLQWFAEGRDFHTETAKLVFGVEEPTSIQRKLAKAVNFGLNYGGGAETIHGTIVSAFPNLTVPMVQKIIDLKYKTHPRMKLWQFQQVEKARKFDYTENPFSGQRVYFHGEVLPTLCYNFPIQSSGAFLIDRAIPHVYDSLKERGDYLLFQVHDALIVDTSDPVWAAEMLRGFMTAEVELDGRRMSFPVDYKLGRNWGDCISCMTVDEVAEAVRTINEREKNG